MLPTQAFAHTVNNEFNLGANQVSSQLVSPNYIVAYDTANASATG
ncbi:hypothetical protein RV04_GL000644 [Enterococcus hermanniensis]|uniref:Uncharacterized protein n=1 Tax=Enterococcus hermanniensis TaxID=249189 RepID=A0A1L8THI7_9ENTE|nr:hypothetical protein RV04_GL000644 [Enterococcus hermanniensis]